MPLHSNVQLIRHATELKADGRRLCLAIGVFDGVHLGHQQIIRQTLADARQQGGLAVVVTFDRHPSSIVAPDHAPKLIYPLTQKMRTIESIGADALLLLAFDRAFSEQSGEQFIRDLVRDMGRIQSICVGADFVFGHKRSGNVALLHKLGAELGFHVHGMAALALDGEVVSSTRIRAAIQAANFDAASQMLGRPYAIAAKVVTGDQLGRQLGIPTANLEVAGLVLPPNGVYAARATAHGESHIAVLNIGTRPTVQTGSHERRFEVHLLDFAGDLYGTELEVEIIARLRDESKFPSLDALKAQIALDIKAAERSF
jgi:riboflavin kinase/FMN adenylyltransferase